MDFISRSLDATPFVGDLPGYAQVPVVAVAAIVVAVALNVANQLLVPKPKSLPPVVFHWFPVIGSAVTYGLDPYTFFFENRKKVSVAMWCRDRERVMSGAVD